MKLSVVQPRTCGECNACCKTFLVPEVGKNDGNWCQHCIRGKGCAIYESRPEVCRQFKCFWLLGKGSDNLRPDRIGVMMVGNELEIGDGRKAVCLELWELRPGALDQPYIQKLIEANLNARFIVVTHRIETETTYAAHVEMRKEHFSHKDFLVIKSQMGA